MRQYVNDSHVRIAIHLEASTARTCEASACMPQYQSAP
jgi:hypothetical protein